MITETITRNESRQREKKKLITEIAVIVGLVVIFAVLLPLALSAFRLRLLGRFLSLAIVALGIDLIWGYTGLLSLGHGIFFALGGYALAMYLNLQLPPGQLPEFFTLYGVTELPFVWQPFYSLPLTIIALIIVPAIMAGLLGYLIFRNRIKGVYFSILTQAALLVFFNFFNGQQKLINGTNIRDDEVRVRFSGYDPTWFKVLVFAISGAIAGVAGALYTVQTGIITPNSMDVAFSIEMVIWVAVGGRATLVGAVVGTLLVRMAQTFLSEQFPEVWVFFQGALFLIVVTVLPDGLLGGIKRLLTHFGFRKTLITYPSIEEAPEVQLEREELEHK